MSAPAVTVTLDQFEAMEAAYVRGTAQAVKILAFGLQAEAMNLIVEQGAVDHGALLNSLYVETGEVNERAEKLALAIEQGKSSGQKTAGGVQVTAAAKPPDELGELEARVGVCVEHGIYVEMGVTGSATGDHAARPYMAPAAAAMQAQAAGVAAQCIADEVGP